MRQIGFNDLRANRWNADAKAAKLPILLEEDALAVAHERTTMMLLRRRYSWQ